jgi:hypothetical protein
MPTPLPSSRARLLVLAGLVALVQACGGEDGDTPAPPSSGTPGNGGNDGGTPPPPPPPPAGSPTDAQRIAAATSTAASTTNACSSIKPFYWEIGDKTALKASASVQAGATPIVTATSSMNIASASKWLYASYVAQKRDGTLTAADIKYLTFTSGYTNFSTCLPGQTVGGCAAYQSNGVHDTVTDGKFFYDGGHMQNHASLVMNLGSYVTGTLAAEIQTQLGTDVGLSYSQPQLAGGAVSTPQDYAVFLRKLLNGQLRMASLLGTNAVCTNPSATATPACTTALASPLPATLNWHYSLGHWVEDDAASDGSFSSAGAFGFYPWINKDKTLYGIVARLDPQAGSGADSAACGILVRKAWVSGTAQ